MARKQSADAFGIETSTPIRFSAGDKLVLLRQIDRDRNWESLDDRRFCRCCQSSFTGRQVDIVGGTRELGRLRLLCPTENCCSMPKDWIYPTEDVAVYHERARSEKQPRVVKVVRKRVRNVAATSLKRSAAESWRSANAHRLANLFRTLRASAAAPP